MIRIDLEEMKNMITLLEDSIIILEEERTNQKYTIADIPSFYAGETAKVLEKDYTQFLDAGKYHLTLQRMKDIKDALYNSFYQFTYAKTMCEGFAKKIDPTNSYDIYSIRDVEFGQPLKYNSTFSSYINQACEQMSTAADHIKEAMDSVIAECGDLIVFPDYSESYEKVKRIDHFKEAFNRYEEFIVNIDNASEFEGLTGQIGEDLDIDDILLESKYGLTKEEIDELCRINLDGKYAFEEMLTGDFWNEDELSSEQLDKLTRLLIYLCEETQANQQDVYSEMLGRYISSLYELDDGIRVGYNVKDVTPSVYIDTDKADYLLRHVSALGDCFIATEMLSELMENNSIEFDPSIIPLASIQEKGHPYVNMLVVKTPCGFNAAINLNCNGEPSDFLECGRHFYKFNEEAALQLAQNYNLDLFATTDTSNDGKEKYLELMKKIDEQGFTLDQYQSSILDVFMYMDIFGLEDCDDPKYTQTNVDNIVEIISYGATINDILAYLRENEQYNPTDKKAENQYSILYTIVLEAVKEDPALGRMQIVDCSRLDEKENYSVGLNAITFDDKATNSVYLAFRGTSTREWVGNGYRFSCKSANDEDLTDQIREVKAYVEKIAGDMNWTDEMNIITTGHSQGGNDSQVAILYTECGKYIDKCFSYDGQGHSPDLLKDLPRYYEALGFENGEEEFLARQKRMYSVCGNNDFVNRLGQQAFLDENRIIVHCNMKTNDFARCHDIVSMFCSTDLSYGGIPNTACCNETGAVTEITKNLWDELVDMPDDLRYSCQAAIMNLIDKSLHETYAGNFGEYATAKDYSVFIDYGLPVILKAVGDTAIDPDYHNEIKDIMKDVKHQLVIDKYAVSYLVDKFDVEWGNELKFTDNQRILEAVLSKYESREADLSEYISNQYASYETDGIVLSGIAESMGEVIYENVKEDNEFNIIKVIVETLGHMYYDTVMTNEYYFDGNGYLHAHGNVF